MYKRYICIYVYIYIIYDILSSILIYHSSIHLFLRQQVTLAARPMHTDSVQGAHASHTLKHGACLGQSGLASNMDNLGNFGDFMELFMVFSYELRLEVSEKLGTSRMDSTGG